MEVLDEFPLDEICDRAKSWKFGAENFVGDGSHVVSHRSVELVGIGPSARAGVKHRKDTGVLAARRMFASYPQGHGGMFFLRRADGTRMPAGSFRYRYGGREQAVLTSALDLSDARAVGVRAGSRTFVAPLRQGVGAEATSNQKTTDKEYS